ncbi:hypothetical protein BH11PLA1_BH11PLA1_15750 [soil metagenome]
MKPGDAFLLDLAAVGKHLAIIVSDPELDEIGIVLVHITSWAKHREQTCVLGPGDHAFITHESCVLYSETRVIEKARLGSMVRSGALKPMGAVTFAALTRIWDGAAKSTLIPLGAKAILDDQGLLS